MGKIGLIDVDGHNFPNFALMKIAAYHKQRGDIVEWVNHFENYDRVYKSKIFTFSEDSRTCINADEVIQGGTGYNLDTLPVEIETVEPDYSLYPKFKEAYGFLTRGCIRSCKWCLVPRKEGKITPYRDISDVLQSRRSAVLMDNNILASDFGIKQLEKIVDLGCRVDFNQGLDSRLVTDEVAKLLSKVSWIRYIRFACDTMPAVDALLAAISKLNKHGVKNYRIFVYMLVGDVNDAYERSKIMKKLDIVPFAQPFRDFINNDPTDTQKKFARYVNRREIFKSCDWKDYRYNK
jgi:hypothetical protein